MMWIPTNDLPFPRLEPHPLNGGSDRYCEYTEHHKCLMGRYYKCEKCDQPNIYLARVMDERMRNHVRKLEERVAILEQRLNMKG